MSKVSKLKRSRKTRSKRSRKSRVKSRVKRSRKTRSKRSRKSRVKSRVKRSRKSRSKRSRKSRVKRSRKSRSKRSRKIYDVSDIDKLAYKLNKFPGLGKEILSFIPKKELRSLLNDKKWDEILHLYYEKQDEVSDIQLKCKKSLRKAKKDVRILSRQLYHIENYVNLGVIPPKKGYSFIKILKDM